jgi:hypothetical protein
MKLFRKLICWLFGHRSICLYHPQHDRTIPGYSTRGSIAGSAVTAWECERCGHQKTEQWDI